MRPSLFTILSGLFALTALNYFFLWRAPEEQAGPVLTLEALPGAAEGPVEVKGVLRPEHARPYTRIIPVLGQERREALLLVPLTSSRWREGEPIAALVISPEEAGGSEQTWRAVKVGEAKPEMAPGLALLPGAALLELSAEGPPAWLLGGFYVSALVFLGLGLRSLARRARAASRAP